MQRRRTGVDLSRKDFLRLGGAGLAGAALFGVAGCGGGGQSSGNELIFSWGEDDAGVLPGMIEQFNKQNEGQIKVTHRVMPSDTGQYFDQLRTEFQAGGGDIDVIGGDVIWPAQFAANGYILDLSDRFTDTDAFLPAPIQANSYDGKVWGVPWYTDAGLLFYRQDLLEQAGYSEPPATWEELKEMALKVKQDAGIQSGFVFQGAEYEGGVCNGLEHIRTHGGEVLDPNDPSKVIVGSPESASGLETWHSMIEEGAAPQAVLQYEEDPSYGAFLRGDAVFARHWPYILAIAADPQESNVKPDQIDIAPIPVSGGNPSSSTLGGWNFFINATSDKQEEAWEFIKFMTSPEQQKINAVEGGKNPTRRSLYEDQEVLEKHPVARLGKEVLLGNAEPRPLSPVYSDMSLEMAEQFNAALGGDVPPDEAVQTLQNNLQQIAEEAQAAG